MDNAQADYLITGLQVTITLPRNMAQPRAARLAVEAVQWFRRLERGLGTAFDARVVSNAGETWLILDNIQINFPRVPNAISETLSFIQRFVEDGWSIILDGVPHAVPLLSNG